MGYHSTAGYMTASCLPEISGKGSWLLLELLASSRRDIVSHNYSLIYVIGNSRSFLKNLAETTAGTCPGSLQELGMIQLKKKIYRNFNLLRVELACVQPYK